MRAIYYFFPSFFNRPSGALYPSTPLLPISNQIKNFNINSAVRMSIGQESFLKPEVKRLITQ